MAAGSLNLKVSKADFEQRIEVIAQKISNLDSVIQQYREAKANLDQFVEEGDSTYEQWIERIDANVTACGKAKAALMESKASLEKTVEQMEGMSGQLRETIASATEEAKSTVEAAIKIAPLL